MPVSRHRTNHDNVNGNGQSTFATNLAAARRAFCSHFRRSRKGNLWRHFNLWMPDGTTTTLTMTVFPDRLHGSYSYCIAGPFGQTKFSSTTYTTEDAALDELAAAYVGYEVCDADK